MKFLVVSDREFRPTSRGIDLITSILAENGHTVDHLVFFTRKRLAVKQVSANIRQLYLYDSIKLYHLRLQFLFPDFLLFAYFNRIIRANSHIKFNDYDYVVLESGHPTFITSSVNTKIIFRQSDPAITFFKSNRRIYNKLESETIEKSSIVLSALEPKYFPPGFNKIFHCHSGFIPCPIKSGFARQKTILVMGGDPDWILLDKLSAKFPDYSFYIIGIRLRLTLRKNIISMGYLVYSKYQDLLASVKLVLIPFSKRYSGLLQRVSFTAKILVSMQLGMPIILKSYGDIQESDPGKKLFVYNTRAEALAIFGEVIQYLDNGTLDYNVSAETQRFLDPQTTLNRKKEMESILENYISTQ